MPRTKFQDLVFTIIMVITMVYFMTLYNISLETGISNSTFLIALKDMWVEAIAAFFAQRYLAGPIAKKLVGRILEPGKDKSIFIIVAMACFTVCIMAPVMTLFVSIFHNGFRADLISLWLPKLILNFPFALIIQIFFVGPFVRLTFRSLFKKQLQVPIEAYN